MSTIHSFHENAASASAFDGTEIVPVIQNGVLKQSTSGSATSISTVNATAGATTLTVTQAAHGNRTITLSNTAPIAVTLPAATGTGTGYRFVLLAAATATSSTIKVANTVDNMTGLITSLNTTAGVMIGFKSTTTDDTISLNGTTTGGGIGAVYEITDIASGKFLVQGRDTAAMTTTPYSATV